MVNVVDQKMNQTSDDILWHLDQQSWAKTHDAICDYISLRDRDL